MSKSLISKIKHEIIKVWILSFYFAMFFIAISYFRYAILKQAEVPYTDFGMGVIRALVCAKFLMISETLYPIRLNDGKPAILHILGRSLLYAFLVTVLIALEEAVMAHIHGQHILDAITGLRPGSVQVFFSLEILYWLMVIPYVLISALIKAFGIEPLSILLFNVKSHQQTTVKSNNQHQ